MEQQNRSETNSPIPQNIPFAHVNFINTKYILLNVENQDYNYNIKLTLDTINFQKKDSNTTTADDKKPSFITLITDQHIILLNNNTIPYIINANNKTGHELLENTTESIMGGSGDRKNLLQVFRYLNTCIFEQKYKEAKDVIFNNIHHIKYPLGQNIIESKCSIFIKDCFEKYPDDLWSHVVTYLNKNSNSINDCFIPWESCPWYKFTSIVVELITKGLYDILDKMNFIKYENIKLINYFLSIAIQQQNKGALVRFLNLITFFQTDKESCFHQTIHTVLININNCKQFNFNLFTLCFLKHQCICCDYPSLALEDAIRENLNSANDRSFLGEFLTLDTFYYLLMTSDFSEADKKKYLKITNLNKILQPSSKSISIIDYKEINIDWFHGKLATLGLYNTTTTT